MRHVPMTTHTPPTTTPPCRVRDSLTAAADNNNAGCHCNGVSEDKTGGMKGKKAEVVEKQKKRGEEWRDERNVRVVIRAMGVLSALRWNCWHADS